MTGVCLLLGLAPASTPLLAPQDFEWVVRQGAAVERQILSGKLPDNVRAILRGLSEQFYSEPTRGRVAARFRELDWDHSG
jgi:hypothetical protein